MQQRIFSDIWPMYIPHQSSSKNSMLTNNSDLLNNQIVTEYSNIFLIVSSTEIAFGVLNRLSEEILKKIHIIVGSIHFLPFCNHSIDTAVVKIDLKYSLTLIDIQVQFFNVIIPCGLLILGAAISRTSRFDTKWSTEGYHVLGRYNFVKLAMGNETLITQMNESTAARKYLLRMFGQKITWSKIFQKSELKNILKYIWNYICANRAFNQFHMLIFCKADTISESQDAARSFMDMLKENIIKHLSQSSAIIIYQKQDIKVAFEEINERLFIGKFIHFPTSRKIALMKIAKSQITGYDNFKDEFKNLSISKSIETRVKTDEVFAIPKPIGFIELFQRNVIIQEFIPGNDLESQIWKKNLLRDHNQVGRIQNRLVNQLIKFHQASYLEYDNQTDLIDAFYYDLTDFCFNSDDLDLFNFHTDYNFKQFTHIVQHGDFCCLNIIWEQETAYVIDWEWLFRGYPPLFDLFMLIWSFNYNTKSNKPQNSKEHYYQSFVDIFFHKNWYSDMSRVNVLHYCSEMKIDPGRLHNYFLAYLVVRYNRYKFYRNKGIRIQNLQDRFYEKLYIKFIQYFIENRSKCVF
ncbi:MAG: aminoglycoside phosphotransferase family protein [Pseudomonadota bacterium]